MKAALAGTASTKFLNVFEAAFGKEENEEEGASEIQPTEEEEPEVLPEEAVLTKDEADEDEPSTSTSTKRQTCSTSKQPPTKKSRKQAVPTKSAGSFLLQDATPIFPDKANKAGYLHTGVNDEFISHRESGPFSKVAIYKCNYARAL